LNSVLAELIKSGHFEKEDTIVLFAALFNAGIDTTYKQIMWKFIHLAQNPEIQQKVHDELYGHFNGQDMGTDKFENCP